MYVAALTTSSLMSMFKLLLEDFFVRRPDSFLPIDMLWL